MAKVTSKPVSAPVNAAAARAVFAAETAVSRETLARFDAYAALLERWQARINLVGPSTLADLWTRHFLDSAQLLPLLPPGTRTLVDLGSGAGFPGLVLAILGVPEVHLIESDGRKAAFLAEAARATGTQARIHARRIADVPAFPADVVTARALAPLVELVPMARRFLAPGGVMLFAKGQSAEQELTALEPQPTLAPRVTVERFASRTDQAAIIFRMREAAGV